MTCRDRDGVLEEETVELGSDGNYYPKPRLTKVDDIVKQFKHDAMPELKGTCSFRLSSNWDMTCFLCITRSSPGIIYQFL